MKCTEKEMGRYVLPFLAPVSKSWISTSFSSFSFLNGVATIACIRSTIIS